MSRYRISIPCKKCGSPQENPDRISRKMWQKIIFPNSGKFRCSTCGKEAFVFNTHSYAQSSARANLANY